MCQGVRVGRQDSALGDVATKDFDDARGARTERDRSTYEQPTPRHMGRRREMTKIFADELQPGDIVEYAGRLHTVSHVGREAGRSWPIAADDTGWAMALGHHPINVLRTAA